MSNFENRPAEERVLGQQIGYHHRVAAGFQQDSESHALSGDRIDSFLDSGRAAFHKAEAGLRIKQIKDLRTAKATRLANTQARRTA